MGITVTTAAALATSGNAAASGSASSAGTTTGAAAEFAALLAGQVSDLSQFLQNGSSQISLAISGLPGKDAAGDSIVSPGEEDSDEAPLDAIALFDALAAHAAAKPANEPGNTADIGRAADNRGLAVGEGGRQPGPTVLNLLGQRQQAAADPLTGNGEAAKLAGETEIVTPGHFANALAAQERTQTTARSDAQPSIATPLHDPRWAQQLGEKVVWLARGDVQNAQINITPAQLGPIQINISLNGDQMTAHFVSAHQEVRQALEDAMPRLREMLSGAGINLGQSNVGSQAQQQQQAQQQSSGQFGETPRSFNEDAILSADTHVETGSTVLPAQRGRGMVDLFA